MPTTSIILIDGSFRDGFHAVGGWGAQDTPDGEYEVIWVEYYTEVNPRLREEIEKVPNAKLVTLGRHGEYHSSYCFNAGIEAAEGDLILVPDGDLLAEPGFLGAMTALHERNPNLVTYNYRINEPEERRESPATLEHLKEVGVMTHPWNWGGCLGVRRQWLVEINGYEQHPVFATGDHANDFDVYVRLKNLGLQIAWPREPVLYHPWHPGTLRFAQPHRLQSIVSQHRAHTLDTLAFQGLDPARNTEVPAELAKAIDDAYVEFARSREAVAFPPAARFLETEA